MTLEKATPILFVDAIEPCLPFWCEQLGLAVQAEVPDGDRLGFVILAQGPLELMLQTRASVLADLAIAAPSGNCLYLTVASLEPIVAAVDAAALEVVVPRRKTFYGADEIFVREPGGNLVGFAAHASAG